MSVKKKQFAHPLAHRHSRQIATRKLGVRYKMAQYWALTWRPGENKDSFLGDNVYRTLGSASHVSASSDVSVAGDARSECIYLKGHVATMDPQTGDVYYGGANGACFAYDFAKPVFTGAKGRVLDPKRNPSLVTLGLEMDKLRERAAIRSFRCPEVPLLPAVYHGFSKDGLPGPVDTPAIRRRIVARMAACNGDIITETTLAKMSSEEVMTLIAAEWPDLIIRPGEGDNSTGLWLIENQFYPHPLRALRSFECFTHLLNAEIYNPVRLLHGVQDRIANPARRAAKLHGIQLGRDPSSDVADEQYSNDEAAKLLSTMRDMLGVWSPIVSDSDLASAVDNPDEPIVPQGIKNPVERIGRQATIDLMRAVMPRYADCCTDDALIRAAENPSEHLVAAGLPRIQVMSRSRPLAQALCFGPKQTGMDHIHADYWSVKSWWLV